MRIDIAGYVTKPLVNYHFTINVTSDRVERPSLSFSDIQVEKEVTIFISPGHYPTDYHSEFETITKEDKYHRDKINKCSSLGSALKIGDRVKCSVFIVEGDTHNGVTTQKINKNRNDIETYAKFPLWLYPDDDFFKRLEVDSQKSLKFRKQWFYTHRNWGKWEKITGGEWNDYKKKPWINKHPIRTFPRIWGIRFRTAVSNLWERLTGQETLLKVSLIANIILAFITTISVALNIWLLFFKNPPT